NGCRAWTTLDCVGASAPRSRGFAPARLRCSDAALPASPGRDERSRLRRCDERLSRLDDAGLRWRLRSALTGLRTGSLAVLGRRLASLAQPRRTQSPSAL